MKDSISIKGAREHNLKNINLDLPKNRLIVFTGISGSGKSSLAFDTIYAEGQRRYVESLSSYARQFLGVMDKPDVDQIDGLSPSISIGQKEISHNPRSTVGTVTEIYDYLRLLFARIGHPHCPQCGREIKTQSPQQIVDQILGLLKNEKSPSKKRGVRLLILAPLVRDRKGEYSSLLADLKRRGFIHVRIDGKVKRLDEDFVLIRTNRHTIEAVIDRLVVTKFNDPNSANRLAESVGKALKLGNGVLVVSLVKDSSFDFPEYPEQMVDHLFSELFACPSCNISLPLLEPRSFSFNSPHGACPECDGLGIKLEVDPEKIYNRDLSINEGGIFPWSSIGEGDSWRSKVLEAVAKKNNFSLDKPIKDLPEHILELLLFGSGDKRYAVQVYDHSGNVRTYDTKLEGVINNLERRFQETDSDNIRSWIKKFMKETPCSECGGTRLKKEVLSVSIKGKNIAEVTQLSIRNLHFWIDDLFPKGNLREFCLSTREKEIAKPIIKELKNRVEFLQNVGLDYLSLNRTAFTLSSGEAQRIRLASQIGSGLSGVLYVLDEPSIGLHYRDHGRLLNTLTDLRDLGNTVIVVEHDPQTILKADWVVDFGPMAGDFGGEIIYSGEIDNLLKNKQSLTGLYLSGKKGINIDKRSELAANYSGSASKEKGTVLKINGCKQNNLKDIDVGFPLHNLICVTGVSGSGKSTLVMDTLFKRLATEFFQTNEVPGDHHSLEGLENINKIINIDQSPIGRTPRSNPATYTGTFTPIRELLSKIPESRARGYEKGRFSFNVRGGRCENCRGEGLIKIEMQFLPDVYVDCEVCGGKRYNRETLEIKYKGYNISQILEMSVDKALNFFRNIPKIHRKLETLSRVGLGYIKLGQPAPTLSGGEAQRVKLSKELSKTSKGDTLYILDEPTTGLHSYDIQKLLLVLHQLVRQGNTVIIIEHNLDVIKTADWIIDLGPEGGSLGGNIVAQGRIEDIIGNKKSYTGKYLKEYVKTNFAIKEQRE